MRITAYACDSPYSKIERIQLVFSVATLRQPGFFQIRDDKAAKTTVDMEANVVISCEFPEGNDVILVSVREIDSRSY